MLNVITNHYADQGLVTSRAYLPLQDLSQGHLRVLVMEGNLEGLKGANKSKHLDRELARFFSGNNGGLLSLREIEQAIDQLICLPSNQAQMELIPGQWAAVQYW